MNLSATLASIRYGSLSDEFESKLRELVLAATETGKKGSLTLAITIVPRKDGQVEVVDDLKAKLPEHDKGATILFATPEGNLMRQDPRQLELDQLREVSTNRSTTLRDVG